MFKKILAGAAAGMIAAVGLAAPATAVTSTTADVYVFHGVPGLSVDIWVNDELTAIQDFTAGNFAGPVALPTGSYDIDVTAAGAADNSSPALSLDGVAVTAGTSYTIVAYLDAAGDPAIKAFVNDISNTAAGEGRLTVRHVAEFGAVDIASNGTAVTGLTGLTNPNEVVADLAAGIVPGVTVNAAGTSTVGIDVGDFEIKEGVNRIVYAYGTAEGLEVAVQELTGLHSTPGGVNSGEAGLAADPNPATIAWSIAGIMALLGAAVFAVARTRTVRAER